MRRGGRGFEPREVPPSHRTSCTLCGSARFALLSTFKTDDSFVNTDIPCASGGYRPQDLTKPPFSLPAPLALFDEMYPIDRRISLGLWRVGALRHRLL